MKRAYVNPTIEYEAFMPSEFVATCAEGQYILTCGYCFNGYSIPFTNSIPESEIYVADGAFWIDKNCAGGGPDGSAPAPSGSVTLHPSNKPASISASDLAGKCTSSYGGQFVTNRNQS